MKTKLKSMLSIAALAIAGFAGSLVATPAQANVNCPLWPTPTVPGSAYALNGHIYDCMPVPRNSAESQFQIDVRNRVNSAISDMTSDEKNKASAKLVDIVIAYDRTTAESKVGVPVTPSTTMPNETGRSFVLLNGAPNIQHPTTMVWVYAPSQWNPNVIPSSLGTTLASQLGGTVHHEYGHQFDRIWAQTPNGYSPANAVIVNNTTNTHFLTALSWDVANLSQTDRNTMINNYGNLVSSTTPFAVKANEIFAEEFAMTNGGNFPTQDAFLQAHFTCSYRYLAVMEINNGLPPSTPQASFCWGHTAW